MLGEKYNIKYNDLEELSANIINICCVREGEQKW